MAKRANTPKPSAPVASPVASPAPVAAPVASPAPIASPEYGKRVSKNGKEYYRWAGHLGPCMHRAIVGKKFSERLVELVKQAESWAYQDSEVEAAVNDAHSKISTAAKLLHDAAVIFEKHRLFKPMGGGTVPSAKIVAGAAVQIRLKFAQEWADVINPKAPLTIRSIHGNKAVCATADGDRVIVPIRQLQLASK